MDVPRFAFLDHSGPIAFAHRGGALEGPENTRESFGHAHDLGYRYMETDVLCTKDGIVVTHHDQDLQRTAQRDGLVRDMSWKELSSVRLGGGEQIPRLDELLAAWPDVRWNLDAKHDSVVGPLIETIHRSGAIDRVCVTSFSDRRVWTLRRALGSKACTAMGPIAVAGLRFASLLPSPAPIALTSRLAAYGAVQVPIRQGRIPLVDRRFIDAAHNLGLQVHVWTVDDEATMDRLLGLGVDGIMTDRPTALREVLARRRIGPR
jgi:glycerophosphoryl diester phosphodiesterase